MRIFQHFHLAAPFAGREGQALPMTNATAEAVAPAIQTRITAIRSLCAIFAVMVALFLHARPARAQVQVAREVIQTAVEKVVSQAGKQGMRELTEMGGRAAVQQVIEQSAREGGEQLVAKVTQYGVEEGPLAIRAIGRSPAKMVSALDELAPTMRGAAIQAMERDPQVLLPLVRQHGAAALEVAARHPGVGEQVVQRLGPDGITLGRRLSTDQSILLMRHADEIAQLTPAQRAGVVSQILRSPGKVLEFLETHPRVLMTTAGVGVVLAIKGDIIGDGGVSKILADGRVVTTPAHPGLIERILPPSLAFLSTPITVLAGIVGVGVAGWFAMQLWGAWRLQRLRHVVAMSAAQQKLTHN